MISKEVHGGNVKCLWHVIGPVSMGDPIGFQHVVFLPSGDCFTPHFFKIVA